MISSLYCPPNTNQKDFIREFKKLQDAISKKKHKEWIIGLDHNMDFLKSDINSSIQDFMEFLIEKELYPVTTRPTRITKTSATLIDNIIMSHTLYNKSHSSVLMNNLSDHLPCILIIHGINTGKGETITVTKRNMKGDNMKSLKVSLSSLDWSKLATLENPSDQFDYFHSKLTAHLDRYCPEKKHTIPDKFVHKEPWITKGLINSIEKCKSLYIKYLHQKDTDSEMKDKVYRKTLQKILQTAKRNYYTEQCVAFKSNTKKLWKTINEISRKTNDKSSLLDCIKVNNINYYDGQNICSEFGRYFSTVGNSLASKIPKSVKSINHYLDKINRNTKSIFLTPCIEMELIKIIEKLPNKKSAGHDDMSNVFLKELKCEIVAPLTIIFNNSLNSGTFPALMKHAEVVPLYKSGPKNETTNYRPISLLLTLSKILEKVMYKRIYNFLNVDQLFKSQYGFRSQHSCQDAITELTSSITKNWENNKSSIAVFTDLSKAFDTLQHEVLFNKIEKYGIRGNSQKWFQSYLSDCTMSAKCKIKGDDTCTISEKFGVSIGKTPVVRTPVVPNFQQ